MEAELIQVKNSKTGRYTKIDKTSGDILSHKKSDGPYKNIPIVSIMETKDVEKPSGPHPDQMDASRRWFGKKIRPAKTIK